MTVIGSATLRLLGDTADFIREMEKANKKWQDAGRKFQDVGKKLTAGVTLPLLAVGAAIVKTGVDFEAEMSKIVGLVGVSSDQVNAWKKDLIALGPAVGKGPKELAQALFFVTSAGFEGSAAIDVLTISAKASSAGLGDTATIADALTSAINAYGMENLSASAAADILTAAVKKGKLEASQLAPVLGTVLPTASALGIAFEDVAGVLAVFSKTGVNAAEGSTQLNSIMAALLKTSTEGHDALDSVNLSLTGLREQAAGPGGLIGVMRTLDEAFLGNVDALATVIPNTRAFRGVMNALAQDGDSVSDVMDGVKNSTGDMETAFAEASSTAKFQFGAGMAEIKAALIEMSAVVIPPVVTAFKIIASVIGTVGRAFGTLPAPLQTTIVALAGLLAAVGPILFVVGKLITAVGALGPVFTFLAPAIAAIATPVVLAVAAFASLVLAGRAVIQNWDVLKFEAGQLWEAIKGVFSAGIEGVKNLLGGFVEGVTDRFAWMANIIVGNSIVPDMMKLIGKEFDGLDKIMVAPADEAVAAVKKAFENIVGPGKVKGINYAVSIDATELFGNVMVATESAALAFGDLSDNLFPTVEGLSFFGDELNEMTVLGGKYGNTIGTLDRSSLSLSRDLFATSTEVGIFGDLTASTGDQLTEMARKNQEAINRQNAALKDSELSLRIHKIASDTMAMASDQTAMAFQNLQRSAAGIISSFTPMGMLATVLGSALEALKPAFDALQAPLKILGTILASAVMPILKALFPVIKFLSLAASYVVEGFLFLAGVTLKVTGWLKKAIGSFVFGIAKLLSKIPGIGGIFKPLKLAGKAQMKAGEAMMDAGQGMLDAIDDVRAGRDEIRALEWPEEAVDAAAAQVDASQGTTGAVEGTTAVIGAVGSELTEIASGILDGILTLREIAMEGVSLLGVIAGGPPNFDPLAPALIAPGTPEGAAGATAGGGGPQVIVEEGAIVISSDGENPEEDGREAARGFMDEISGERFNRTRRLITRSGRIERES